jgi:hypothetical protein
MISSNSQKPLTQPHREASQNVTASHSLSSEHGKRSAGTKGVAVEATSVVVSAVRVIKVVMSIVESVTAELSTMVVISSSVAKEVSIIVSAVVREIVESTVVKGADVSSIVTEDVSTTVWTEVSEVMRVVSDRGSSVELGLGRHAPALTARREIRTTKLVMKLGETILTSVMTMELLEILRRSGIENKQHRSLIYTRDMGRTDSLP